MRSARAPPGPGSHSTSPGEAGENGSALCVRMLARGAGAKAGGSPRARDQESSERARSTTTATPAPTATVAPAISDFGTLVELYLVRMKSLSPYHTVRPSRL